MDGLWVPHTLVERTELREGSRIGRLGGREVVGPWTVSGGAQDTWATWWGVVTAFCSGLKLFPSEKEKRSRNSGST